MKLLPTAGGGSSRTPSTCGSISVTQGRAWACNASAIGDRREAIAGDQLAQPLGLLGLEYRHFRGLTRRRYVPITPPSRFRITTVADRGRPPGL
jgi:hypothetical protein